MHVKPVRGLRASFTRILPVHLRVPVEVLHLTDRLGAGKVCIELRYGEVVMVLRVAVPGVDRDTWIGGTTVLPALLREIGNCWG